jgi:hypothetical protein
LGIKNAQDPFEYITEQGLLATGAFGPKPEAEQKQEKWQQGQAMYQGAQQKAAAAGLTPDDLDAIRILSAGDYKYMNPVLANNEGWLRSQIETVTQGFERHGDLKASASVWRTKITSARYAP